MIKKSIFSLFALTLLVSPFWLPTEAKAQFSSVRTIIFPVLGNVSYYDDFGNDRSGGRTHEGNDIFAPKMRPLVAAVDGTIVSVNYPEATWGYAITIRDADGYTYHYIHMNNDTPGTDDGQGGGMNAYAPEMRVGNRVVAGQLVGYMGDSGNAETTPPHLHFEIRQPDRTAISPYRSLQNATRITSPVPAPKQDYEILPYDNFEGGANIASGNLDTNSDIEVVTGAGPGGGPLVKAFKSSGEQIAAFYAYDPNFRGGVDVTVADIDGDGRNEIITAPGSGGGPHIKVFKIDGTVVGEFFAYDPGFRGGVYVSAADINGDGKAEIITGPGSGGGPHIKVFNGSGVLQNEFFAYDSGFRGGVDVAAIASATNSGTRNPSSTTGGIATAPVSSGGPHVKIFGQDGALKHEFFAYDENFNLGMRIAAGNVRSETGIEVAVIPARGGGPHAKIFSQSGEILYSNFTAFEVWWRGGYDIALHNNGGYLSSFGGRRASVREAFTTSSNNFNNVRRR